MSPKVGSAGNVKEMSKLVVSEAEDPKEGAEGNEEAIENGFPSSNGLALDWLEVGNGAIAVNEFVGVAGLSSEERAAGTGANGFAPKEIEEGKVLVKERETDSLVPNEGTEGKVPVMPNELFDSISIEVFWPSCLFALPSAEAIAGGKANFASSMVEELSDEPKEGVVGSPVEAVKLEEN